MAKIRGKMDMSGEKIRFLCPHCGGKLAGEPYWTGAIVHCPHCSAPTFFPVISEVGVEAGSDVPPAATLMAVELKGICPACHAKFRVDSRAMGRRTACPECGRRMAIPRVPACPEPLRPDAARSPSNPSAPVADVAAFPLTAAEIAFLMAPVAPGEGKHDSQIDAPPASRDA